MKQDILNKIKDRIIPQNALLISAFKQMDKIAHKLLLVFEGEKFLNILSVGDIQRAIIKNISLNTPVSQILRKEARIAKSTDSIEEIKKEMIQNRAECMPIVDNHGNIVDVIFWEDVFGDNERRIVNNLKLPVVIMAGGIGTRLKPITNVFPKPLIPIGEKTILETILDRFIDVGCNQFYISVKYKAEIIKYYFEALNNFNYKIKYLTEEKPLGTAGSLYLLKNKINDTFFVSNCDILIEEDYGEIYKYHKDNKNELTIIAAIKHYPIPYGIINTGDNGKLESLNEKPEFTFKINSGMYILEPHLLDEIPKNKFFHITNLIENVQKRKGKVGVFPVSEGAWMDIGSWNEYLQLINKK